MRGNGLCPWEPSDDSIQQRNLYPPVDFSRYTGGDSAYRSRRTSARCSQCICRICQPRWPDKKIEIPIDEITYSTETYTALTAGDYMVNVRVSDRSVLVETPVPGLHEAFGERNVKIAVAEKLYTVIFEPGEHGSFLNPSYAVAMSSM